MPLIFARMGLEVIVSVTGRLCVRCRCRRAALQRVANRYVPEGEGAKPGDRPGLFAGVEMSVDFPDRAAIGMAQRDPPLPHMQHPHWGARQKIGDQGLGGLRSRRAWPCSLAQRDLRFQQPQGIDGDASA